MNASRSAAAYDLHNHTHWSFDAAASVGDYFEKAARLGMRCFAITEHHHRLSAPEIDALAPMYPEIRTLRAAEFTAQTSFGAVDLLCYGLPRQATPELGTFITENLARQVETGRRFSAAMRRLGIPYTDDERREVLLQYKPARVIEQTGITHARDVFQQQYFLARGWVDSEEAYAELRRQAMQDFSRPPWVEAARLVEIVRKSGGILCLAHPFAYFQGADPRRMDALREECGLDAIECAHPKVPAELTPVYRAYCVRHGLASTGGSDSHFIEDIETGFARHGGGDDWLDEFLERIGD